MRGTSLLANVVEKLFGYSLFNYKCYLTQAILALNIFRGQPTQPSMQPPASGGAEDHCNFLGHRSVLQGQGHRVVVRADVEGVLVGERHVDARAGAAALA